MSCMSCRCRTTYSSNQIVKRQMPSLTPLFATHCQRHPLFHFLFRTFFDHRIFDHPRSFVCWKKIANNMILHCSFIFIFHWNDYDVHHVPIVAKKKRHIVYVKTISFILIKTKLNKSTTFEQTKTK